MSEPAVDLRSFLLTPQETRVIYAALDLSVAFQNAMGSSTDPIIEIRDRFQENTVSTNPCPVCDGTGTGNPLPPSPNGPRPCSYCKGTGVKP